MRSALPVTVIYLMTCTNITWSDGQQLIRTRVHAEEMDSVVEEGIGLLADKDQKRQVTEEDAPGHRKKRAFDRANCDKKYLDLDKNHTMCLVDVGTDRPLTKETEQEIVKQHNDLRAGVPETATNLMKVVWDAKIAKVAAKWARQCQVGHDKARGVPEYSNVYVGQNAAYGYDTFAAAIQAWYDEIKDFKFGVGSINGGKVGHFTQVVGWRVAKIGCGEAYCPDSIYTSKIHHICNYAVGQFEDDGVKPYTRGESCAACPKTCDGKLCDCKGTLCLNGGEIDMNTCKCKCTSSLYTGETCEKVVCPDKEEGHCGIRPESDCEKYSNIPSECPQLCRICPRPCNGTRCKNNGELQADCTCKCPASYKGETCETLDCSVPESSSCATWPESDCDDYYNVPYDCPALCKKCAKPCKDMTCENRGTLNTTSCKCKCGKYYKGDRCQDLDCSPVPPHYSCTQWPSSYCTIYANVPFDCPSLCGKCPKYNCQSPDQSACAGYLPEYCHWYWTVPYTCPHKCGHC